MTAWLGDSWLVQRVRVIYRDPVTGLSMIQYADGLPGVAFAADLYETRELAERGHEEARRRAESRAKDADDAC